MTTSTGHTSDGIWNLAVRYDEKLYFLGHPRNYIQLRNEWLNGYLNRRHLKLHALSQNLPWDHRVHPMGVCEKTESTRGEQKNLVLLELRIITHSMPCD